MGYVLRDGYGDRHPSTQDLLAYFDTSHLTSTYLGNMSRMFQDFAYDIADQLPDTSELTVGLRKLMEAKDCIVRAAVRQLDRKGD